jgi:hypothetical protein
MEGGTGLEPVSGGFADHSVSHFAIRPIFISDVHELLYQLLTFIASIITSSL